MKILLTDCNSRKAFDIYNILCRHFEPSAIILTNLKNSKWQERLIYIKSPHILRKNSDESFAEDLLLISLLYSDELIVYLPIEEDTTSLFYSFIKKQGSLNFLYNLPHQDIFNLAKDKYLLNKFCLQNNIPAPALFEKNQILQLNENDFIPLIVKPRNGSGSIGIKHINNFSQKIELENLSFEEYVIQEKLENGKDVKGAFFLCEKGIVISNYCHERIRTFPLNGGVTVYSQITENKEIINTGSELLKKLNWSGFAMVEFLWDKVSNSYKVIEINPRLWGSILLSEFSNANFILNYINLCNRAPLIKSNIYQAAKIRWMPFELFNWIYSKEKIKEFWKINRKNTCYINFTYAHWWSIIWFHLFFYFNITNFKTLLLKWKK